MVEVFSINFRFFIKKNRQLNSQFAWCILRCNDECVRWACVASRTPSVWGEQELRKPLISDVRCPEGGSRRVSHSVGKTTHRRLWDAYGFVSHGATAASIRFVRTVAQHAVQEMQKSTGWFFSRVSVVQGRIEMLSL